MPLDEAYKKIAQSILSLQEDLDIDPLDAESTTQKIVSMLSEDLLEQFKTKRDFLEKSTNAVKVNEENIAPSIPQEAVVTPPVSSGEESPTIEAPVIQQDSMEDAEPIPLQDVFGGEVVAEQENSVEENDQFVDEEIVQSIQEETLEEEDSTTSTDIPSEMSEEIENIQEETEIIDSIKNIFSVDNFEEDLPELEELPQLEDSPLEEVVQLEEVQSILPQSSQEDPLKPPKTQEEQYRAAFEAFKNYKEENQEIIYKAFSDKLLTNEQELSILQKIEHGGDEEIIVQEVRTYIPPKIEREKLFSRGSTRESTIFILGILLCVCLSVCTIGYKYVWSYVRGGYYYKMGVSCIERDQYVQSDEYFEKGMSISPNLSMCLRYANLYEDIRYLEKSKEKYFRATALKENNLPARLGLVRVFLEEENLLEAQNAAQKSLEFHPDSEQAKIALAEVFVEKGKKGDSRAWNDALQIYQDLLDKKGIDYDVLAKKMRICSLRGEFPLAKDIYDFLKEKKPKLLYKNEHAAFHDFLLSTFVFRYRGKTVDEHPVEEQFYTVQTVRNLSDSLVTRYPKDPQIVAQSAEWYFLTGQYTKSLDLLENALMLVRPRERKDRVDRLKALRGINLYQLGKWEEGSQILLDLQNSKHAGLANYYLGEIHLKKTQNLAKAAEYFDRSSSVWREERIVPKEDVLYKSAYLNYWRLNHSPVETSVSYQGKDSRKNLLLENLENWAALAEIKGETVEISYFMGNLFLEMGEPELAAAQYRLAQQGSEKFLEKFLLDPGSIGKDVLGKIQILSDVCNNLGVSYVRSSSSRKVKNMRNVSMKHFIDSIDMKDRLQMDNGVPKANFNRLIHPEWLQQGLREYEILSTYKPDFF